MKIITVATIKGGTGKTTTAGALVQAAAIAGKKVLAIDLDPQSNLSYWLRADFTKKNSYDLLNETEATEAIQQTNCGAMLIAGSANLIAVTTRPGSAKRLAQAIEPIKNSFDLIVIDTAPAMGELQNNALYLSTDLICPVLADSLSLQGLYRIIDIAKHIQQNNPSLKTIGAVITQFDARPKINRFMKDTIENTGKQIGIPLLATIRNGIAIRESMAMQESLYEYAPTSKPAQDYQELYKKIMKED